MQEDQLCFPVCSAARPCLGSIISQLTFIVRGIFDGYKIGGKLFTPVMGRRGSRIAELSTLHEVTRQYLDLPYSHQLDWRSINPTVFVEKVGVKVVNGVAMAQVFKDLRTVVEKKKQTSRASISLMLKKIATGDVNKIAEW